MVNVITELEKRNKELLNEIEQLKAPLQFKQLNNEEIRAWIGTVLSERHYTDNPDVDVVSEIMKVAHCNQEDWAWFCKAYPTEAGRGNVILNAYSYYPYYKQTMKLYQVRDDARRKIFINLINIKLNSEESKELFRKWISEGKLENGLTMQEILEKGYKNDSISQACYSYVDIRHLSLDELISSWNELTVNLNKKAVKVSELQEEVKQLETELEKQDGRIEELEDRVDIEVEMNLQALDKAKEWRERQLKEKTAGYIANERKLLDRIKVLENNIIWLENKEQIIKKYKDKELPALPKKQKQNKLLKLKKLVSKVKEKTQEKFRTFIVQKSK